MRMLRHVTLAITVLSLAGSAWAQAAVTASDLTRLENTAAEIEKMATSLKKTDATRAVDVEKTLADYKDEITYLKVKMRRDGVTRDEYAALRDKLETLRVRAAGQKVMAQPNLEEPATKM
jgi:septal ring factor EnvC (AmiA/AmiB activator)